MKFMQRSNLHVDVLKQKLAPKLYEYVEKAKEELAYGWYIDLPHNQDSIDVNIEYHLRMLVARMTAKMFMGNPTCRNLEWLKVAVDFSLNLASYNLTLKNV
ncbi:cytochrome P450 [Penicillium angulare]|uniref:cytochrome P450 n=1 Tax=Penicillium angulare TaxID=116970 RepID=UPI00253F99E9|nr:cytochrome P450 [Penicillium angulare]KAJ5288211.1 cytochrome P450 [Penicillium angulare]